MASPVFLMDLIKRILQGKISMSLSYEMETSRAWQTYLAQINQVTPYLEEDLIPFVNTLKRPKRALIVDVPIVMARADNCAWIVSLRLADLGDFVQVIESHRKQRE